MIIDEPPRTPPIEPLEYLAGVKVIDIGDLRVARGKSRRPFSACRHVSLVYDGEERRIWCKVCETTVDSFDAFRLLVEQFNRAANDHKKREEKIKEAETYALRSIAAKNIDKAWQSKSMIPACPHCRNGLLPEHFRNGTAMLGREFAEKRFERSAAKKQSPNET